MPPSPPSVSVSIDEQLYGIRLNISNPENVARNDVYRRGGPEASGIDPSEWTLLGSVGRSVNYTDYEAANGESYEYRVTAVASDDTTANSSVVQGSVSIPMWVMKDLDEPEDTIFPFIDNDPLGIETTEHQASFNPYGRKYPLVIKDAEVKGATFDLSMQFLGEESFNTYKKLRAKQKILLLQSPMPGEQWYFVFASTERVRVLNTNDPYKVVEIGIIEVGRP